MPLEKPHYKQRRWDIPLNNFLDYLESEAKKGSAAATTTFEPVPGIPASNVQSAIQQVAGSADPEVSDTQVAGFVDSTSSLSHAAVRGVVTTTPAEDMPFTPAGGMTATNVQDAILEAASSGTMSDEDVAALVETETTDTNLALRREVENMVPVTRFGAKGDGVTDDTVAIQAAITAGSVFFPPGEYIISDTIRIPEFRSIFGAGRNATRIKAKDGITIPAMFSTNFGINEYIEIGDLEIHGNRANADAGHGVYMDRPWFGQLSRLHIQEMSGHGIFLNNEAPTVSLGAPNKIIETYVINCTGDGIRVASGVTDTQIASVDCGSNGGHAYNLQGISIAMTNCMGWGSISGCYLGGAGNIWISGCRFDINRYYGLWVQTENVMVSGTLIYDNSLIESGTQPGVLLDSGAGRFVMTGCRSFGGAHDGPQQSYGVQLNAGRIGPVTLIGNDFEGNGNGPLLTVEPYPGDKIDRNQGLPDVGIEGTVVVDPSVGDGVADASIEIQFALDSVDYVGGGHVLVPPGTFRVDVPLTIGSNTHLELSPNTVLIRASDADLMIRNKSDGSEGGYGASENITISGGVWDGDADTYPENCTPIAIGHATNVTVRDTALRNLAGGWHLLELSAVKRGKVINVDFSDGPVTSSSEMLQIDLASSSGAFPWFGPYDNTPCDDIEITGCYFHDGTCAGVGSHTATPGHPHTAINIHNNVFENLPVAVKMYDWNWVTVHDNQLRNCTTGIGTLVPPPSLIESVVVSGNLIEGSTEASITMDYSTSAGGVRSVSIRGNRIVGSASDAERGIYVKAGSSISTRVIEEVNITDNAVENIGRYGTSVDFGQNVLIGSNSFNRCGSGSASQSRIAVWVYNCIQTQVSNNQFKFTNPFGGPGTDRALMVGDTAGGTSDIQIVGNRVEGSNPNNFSLVMTEVNRVLVSGNIFGGTVETVGTVTNDNRIGNFVNNVWVP